MVIVGIENIVNLIMREKRSNPKSGSLLEKHIQAWKQQIEIANWKMPTDVKAVLVQLILLVMGALCLIFVAIIIVLLFSLIIQQTLLE
jgi:hypothetical protein